MGLDSSRRLLQVSWRDVVRRKAVQLPRQKAVEVRKLCPQTSQNTQQSGDGARSGNGSDALRVAALMGLESGDS